MIVTAMFQNLVKSLCRRVEAVTTAKWDKLPINIQTKYLIEKQNIKILDENNESITVLNLWQAISRILNPIHDGHTSIIYRNYGSFLNDFSLFDYPITHINDMPISDAKDIFLSLISYETEPYG